jgi:hypothetical protein
MYSLRGIERSFSMELSADDEAERLKCLLMMEQGTTD